ncbi:nitrite reductase small subunit NirD [Sorangium sp. So ce131]|uniref:nitrite reductase small subunit NirD n=1 Tax=Sorangium sp. So ce131 TaxID=3133282 RepID=UPI003F61D9C8
MNELPPEARRNESVTHSWIEVCALEDIIPNTGVCALVGKRQIAVVRVGEGEELYAVSNFDPFSKAFVISRGIVGDKGGVPKIASPIYKQNFDLRTGQCLDDPEVRLPVYAVRVRDGRVEVLAPSQAGAQAS